MNWRYEIIFRSDLPGQNLRYLLSRKALYVICPLAECDLKTVLIKSNFPFIYPGALYNFLFLVCFIIIGEPSLDFSFDTRGVIDKLRDPSLLVTAECFSIALLSRWRAPARSVKADDGERRTPSMMKITSLLDIVGSFYPELSEICTPSPQTQSQSQKRKVEWDSGHVYELNPNSSTTHSFPLKNFAPTKHFSAKGNNWLPYLLSKTRDMRRPMIRSR